MHGSGLTCKFVMGSWTAHVWGSEQLGKHSFPSISSQTPPGLTWFCKDLIDTSPGKATLPCLPVSVDHLRGCVLCAGLSTCAITLWTAYVSYKFFPRPITTPIKSVQSPPICGSSQCYGDTIFAIKKWEFHTHGKSDQIRTCTSCVFAYPKSRLDSELGLHGTNLTAKVHLTQHSYRRYLEEGTWTRLLSPGLRRRIWDRGRVGHCYPRVWHSSREAVHHDQGSRQRAPHLAGHQ